jgi:sec-independent protein translocase protein TatC
MPKVLRPIGHEETLSVVDHLDELRTRLIVSVAALLVAFIVCFWQNNALLNLLNKPLPTNNSTQSNHISGSVHDLVSEQGGLKLQLKAVEGLATSSTFSATDRAYFAQLEQGIREQIKSLPTKTPKQLPITIGVGEPFTTTIVVCLYFALLISLPLLIYQIYAFVIPALNPREAKAARPVMLVAPVLFIAGVVFTYFFVLPPAVHFLQGYNSSKFDILVQANTYYKFEMYLMLGIGAAFQTPLFLAALHRIGVVTGGTLTGNWRYAILIIAIIVAALPGVDPVTMFFEMAPLLLLYLASIVLLKIMDRSDARHAAQELAKSGETHES